MLFLLALLPLIGAVAPALAIRLGRNAAALAAGGVTLTALLVLAGMAPAVMAGETVRASVPWIPALGLDASLFLDPLGLMFAGMILGIGLLVIIYARFYLAAADPMGRFFTYLLLFQGAMLGIVLSDNVLLLLIFWELTSLSSFLLIGFWRHSAEARQGARMALFVTGGGGLALIGGLLILGNIAGSYDLTVILQQKEAIQASPLYLPALLLILGGCFTKSAQFPFHFWLPHAMAAPTPVSAYLHSATMVKAGVFMLARLWPVLAGTEAWFLIVATTGLVTMVFAAWVALFKDDLKGLLAYSTISHLGFLTMLFGLGTPMAALVGVFHIINHATFKAALFLNAGIVDHEAGTRDLKRLGGLFGLMPIAGTLALIAGLSMAGVPPLNGFISKEMMLEEAAHTVWLGQPWVFPVLATLGATLSVAYSLRYIVHVYFGPRRDDYPKAPHDPGVGLWGPPAVLTALVVAIGLAPALFAGPLVDAVAQAVTNGAAPHVHLALWHGVTPALFMSVIAIAIGALALAMHGRLQRRVEALPLPRAKALFDAGVKGATALSRRGIDALQNGSLQRAMAALIGTAVVVGFAGFLGADYVAGERPGVPASPAAVAAWIALVTATALVVLFHRARYISLIYIGIVGLIISLAFAHLSAPDLALTQISVEVVTILLMLLALNLLPKTTPAESRPWRRVRDGALACVAGLGVGGAAWAVMTRPLDSISDYFWDNAYSGGGGTNVVNVILVDFRGFDTFGEIIVLGIAALGIFSLLESVGTGASGRRVAAWKPDTVRSPEHHPMMLVVATRLLLPLAVAVGLYIFLRGHNQPGGGFIAGLVVSIAILMQYMASGYSFADQRLRADHHSLIGAGVLIAAATGLGSLAFGAPFLTSAFDYFSLPLIGEFELATAMLFDTGVALTVIGAVMLALAQLSRVAQSAEKQPPPETLEAMDVDPSRNRPGAASTTEAGR
ncbi:monovalent cation/H+ antiporter subunit A [Brevundimonas sp.]|uniref:monovalent cation/H+ antiporter subunit A n=3 Tax=Brevundimonas sp. TaxID=1871086 RepID=UPI0027EE4C2B|nr:monovalent cation/H+ antiporter subunit A [Brevundimonas sp.]MDQ7812950.1 monovalent cation/H+ antiporter subunit A [Brevundimonas sp.]